MKKISKDSAILKGRKFYFTGKPCKRGHLAMRDTYSSNCVACHRINARASVKRQRAKIKAARKP